MTTDSLELLCFRVGERVFSVDIMGIREILRSHTLTPVPGAPASVAGVLNLRGELVPVVDLHRTLLGTEAGSGESEKKLVVVRAAGLTAGVLVDQVLEVVSIQVEELNPVPGSSPDSDSPLVAAFRKQLEGNDPEVVLLIRLGALLRQAGVTVHGGQP